MLDATIDTLRDLLGPEVVRTDPELLAGRRHDYWAAAHLREWRGEPMGQPGCVVQPRGTEQVQELLRFASSNGVAVVPYGLGSGVCGGVLPTDDVVLLDLSTMDRTREIDEHDLLATFDAGKNGMEAEEEVAARGLTIGHWPQSIAVSSVGGWVSTRASGQFSTAYGNIEDIVYSIEAVLPDGELVHLGKAPRAAAGPDLRHVVMGAEGTMGVITGVTFSLRRAAAARRFTAFHSPDMATGVEAQRRIVQADWRPPVMRLYDGAEVARNFPDHVSGDAGALLMLHEGPAARVDAEVDDVTRIATEAGLVATTGALTEEWLGKRNHVPTWSDFFERGAVVDTIEISAPWSRIIGAYDAVVASLNEVEGIVNASAHSSHVYRSGINLYFSFAVLAEPQDMEARYFECWHRTMEATAANGGGIAHHHGSGRLRVPYLHHDLGAGGVELLRTLKSAVDPAGIMNPGNLIPPPVL
ncbi:FAD-binding oxidoreductase [Dermatobacter hominis]|uniref:FAD-binding oxidoreductase n=1 Tax=Dermatobacter hominis TaxID=2884263 RepID=UPI001D117382|nr:FAD-binding oxidoreductase [Dermatobacter hominis]UDY36576.1 FAD-binding oxidoreductase [Dermatobacter hominis]